MYNYFTLNLSVFLCILRKTLSTGCIPISSYFWEGIDLIWVYGLHREFQFLCLFVTLGYFIVKYYFSN